MASIVQPSDFQGKFTLANTTEEYIMDLIQLCIDEYEPKCLTELLGAELYADLLAGLDEDPILAKWAALKGKVFKSILAYIYWHYQEENATATTGNGETNNANANSTNTTPINKMVRLWNEAVKDNYKTVTYVNSKPDDYPHINEHYPYNWNWYAFGYRKCDDDSVFGFSNSFGI